MTAQLPSGKWAQKWDACKRCKRTVSRHAAKGLCESCYRAPYAPEYRARRAAEETPRQAATRRRKQREWMRAWRAKQKNTT